MSVRGLTCDDHGFGSKQQEWVICGRWPAKSPALLCNDCGFGRDEGRCQVLTFDIWKRMEEINKETEMGQVLKETEMGSGLAISHKQSRDRHGVRWHR